MPGGAEFAQGPDEPFVRLAGRLLANRVEKLVHRQVVLEKRVDALLHLMEKMLEAVSHETSKG